MSNVKISELETTSAVSTSDLMETAIPSGNNYASKKMSIAQLATYLENSVVHSALDTTNKTIIDAINELKSICDSLSASHFIVANQLPTSDINMNAIYLIPKQSTGVNDVYEEYICLDDTTTPATWEKIGETQIDLSNYITFDDADIATTSKNGSMSKADRSKMNGIESGAQKNVQSDWNASSGDAFIKNKPTIPDELADLTDDSTHRVVTDTEKATWNDNRAVNLELTNEDLDDVKTVGFYVGKNGNTCANKPSGFNQFGLYVVRTATSGTGNYYKQILIRPNAQGETWSRSCVNGTWSAWKQEIYTDENVKQSPFASPIPNANYPLLIANSANGTEESGAVWKNTNITYNPSSNTFNVSNGTVKAYTGQYSELVSTFIGFMSGSTLLAYFSPNPNQQTNPVEIVLPKESGTLANDKTAVMWAQNNLLGAKNFLTFPYYHGFNLTASNVVFTVDDDGIITVGGTQASANATFWLMYNTTLPNGTYILSDGGVGTADTYLSVRYYTTSSASAQYYDVGTSGSVTFTVDNWYRVDIRIWSRNGKTANNLVFKPMLRLSTISDNTFEPYAETNRQLTLNKVGWEMQNYLGAKNLLPYPYYYTVGANRGVNYEMQADGGVYLQGTNNSQSSNSYIYLVNSAWAEQMIFDRPVRVSWSGTGTGLEYITLNITKRTGSSGSRTNVLYLESDTEYILTPASNTRYDFEFSVTSLQSVDAYVYPMVRYADVIDDVYAPPAKSNRELSVDVISTLSQLATYESSNSASQAYAVGDYMVWKGGFYRVTAAIASGGTITLNTNVTKTTLGAELKRALT